MNKNQKQFIRPPYDSRFDQLNIINWNFPQKPTFQHGKYCIRFTLILGDGSTLNRQKGGFASAKEAMKYRKTYPKSIYAIPIYFKGILQLLVILLHYRWM